MFDKSLHLSLTGAAPMQPSHTQRVVVTAPPSPEVVKMAEDIRRQAEEAAYAKVEKGIFAELRVHGSSLPLRIVQAFRDPSSGMGNTYSIYYSLNGHDYNFTYDPYAMKSESQEALLDDFCRQLASNIAAQLLGSITPSMSEPLSDMLRYMRQAPHGQIPR